MNVHNHAAAFVRGVVVRCLCVALIQIKSIRAVDIMRPYFLETSSCHVASMMMSLRLFLIFY